MVNTIRWGWGIAAIVFCMSSLFLYYQAADKVNAHCDVDSSAYLERGSLFATSYAFVTPEKPEQPYYALGYPLLIGILYKVFGSSIFVIIIFQVLMALLSCWFIIRLTRYLFGQTAAFFAALLFACNLGYAVFAQFVLTDLVLSFLLLIFFERLIAFFYHMNNKVYLAQAGCALGASIIIKPAALYFVVIAGALIILLSGTWMQRVGRTVIFMACFYAPVGAYMTYNMLAFDTFELGSLDRVNLYYWFYPNVLAYEHSTTADQERSHLLSLSDGVHNHEVVAPRFWRDLSQNPLLFARIWFANVGKTFLGLYATNLKVLVEPGVYGGAVSYFKQGGGFFTKIWSYIHAGASNPWISAIGLFEVFYSLLRYCLGLIGIYFLYRAKRWWELALIVVFITYFSCITGHDGCARFRMMFEFALIVLAAGGCALLYHPAVKGVKGIE